MTIQCASPIRDAAIRVNEIGVDDLFNLYSRAGFLYPAKLQRLAPYLSLIRENWRKALCGGERILMMFTHHDDQVNAASAISTWRSTNRGWVSQHLVSDSSSPLSTRSVLLGAQRTKIERGDDDSQQNWFRPENRFPARVFGSVQSSLGEEYAAVRPYSMFTVGRKTRLAHTTSDVRIVRYEESHAASLVWLASSAEGATFLRAEELASDPQLKLAGDIYASLGLHRSRSIWLAYEPNRNEPVAAVLAYRGPLGMNFSFLENRCHLILHPSATPIAAVTAVAPLLEAARLAYEDFELDEIPIVAPAAYAAALTQAGLDFVRNYNQSIWMREAFEAWYSHVDHFYSRLISRADRKSSSERIG